MTSLSKAFKLLKAVRSYEEIYYDVYNAINELHDKSTNPVEDAFAWELDHLLDSGLTNAYDTLGYTPFANEKLTDEETEEFYSIAIRSTGGLASYEKDSGESIMDEPVDLEAVYNWFFEHGVQA